MPFYLLLDFGATRVKAAICDLDSGKINHINNFPALPNEVTKLGRHEFSPKKIWDQFSHISDHYIKIFKGQIKGIMLSSQMHGFILLNKNNKPITNYVSWKDERSLEIIKGIDTYSIVMNSLKNKFRKITGMNPRPGFPFMNALHSCRKNRITGYCKMITLPDWIAMISNKSMDKTHPTMLAGLGIYDINRNKLSNDLCNLAKKITKVVLSINLPSKEGGVAGYYKSGYGDIPIYVGVGDHQCAVLGAGNIKGKTISINIGTGSQVSVIKGRKIPVNAELRPYFGKDALATITHIPAGRSIDYYLRNIHLFIKKSSRSPNDLWKKMAKLKVNDIENSSLFFDLALFKSAWNYKGNTGITNISKVKLTEKDYLASLVKSFVAQYKDAVDQIDPGKKIKLCIISGGIPKKLKYLPGIFSGILKRKTILPTKIDETLIGLKVLALIASKKANNYIAAQKSLGK